MAGASNAGFRCNRRMFQHLPEQPLIFSVIVLHAKHAPSCTQRQIDQTISVQYFINALRRTLFMTSGQAGC
jgi:hypothetical protein